MAPIKHRRHIITLSARSADTIPTIKRLVLLMLGKRDPDGIIVTSVDVRRAKTS